MRRVKRILAVLLVTFAALLSTPQARAGVIETPGTKAVGTIETPGVGVLDEAETPGLMVTLYVYLSTTMFVQ